MTAVCVGTTNAGPLAVVDGAGAIAAPDGSWAIDWCIGADDRWHVAASEAAVRQRRLEATPVVETAMRVPTGDAVARAYGARVPGRAADLIAIEVVNDTTLPVAVALLLRADEVRLAGDRAVLDGAVEVRFPRAPSRVASGTDRATVEATVTGGGAVEVVAGAATVAPVVAVLFPLAHTARLAAEVAPTGPGPGGGGDGGSPGAVGAVPAPDQVARGWRAQLDRGVAVRLPDERLAEAVDLARAQVLLAAAGDLGGATTRELAALLAALGHQGFGDEAGRVAVALLDRQRLSGRFGRGPEGRADATAALSGLGALAGARLTPEAGELLAGPVAKAAHRLARDAGRDAGPEVRGALVGAADLLVAADQPEAAAAVRALVGPHPGSRPGAPPQALDQVVGTVGADDPTRARYAAGSAALLGAVRPGLVDDRDDGLALFAGLPPAWFGRGVEVHEAPSRFGPVSCALRWHGPRPALLWDVAAGPDSGPEPVLTVPALDPTWSSAERRGEALLAEPGAPGAAPPPAPPRDPGAGGGSFS